MEFSLWLAAYLNQINQADQGKCDRTHPKNHERPLLMPEMADFIFVSMEVHINSIHA
jgi:hypothetical protein